MRRVVITGLGIISPIGNDVDSFWQSVKQQKVGIEPITYFDTTEYKVKLAAEVKDFDPKKYMDPKSARRMAAFSQFAVAASMEAIRNSGLDLEKEDLNEIGTSIGCGVGSLQILEKEHQRLLEKGPNKTSPLMVPMMISNMAAGNVAIQFGLKGKSINIVTACTTGTHSIGEAYRSIQCSDAEVMVAGGTEAAITPIGISGFSALTTLTTSEDPKRASIPFDKERNGFVMGEGAGIVVLESLEHAKRRGAVILGEIVGYGATCDAYHITSPAEDGDGLARAMLKAVKEAGIKPEQVDYINAHGTSTHHNDLFETRAVKKAFGDIAYKIPMSSTKSMVGHLLGGAGGVEFVTTVKSLTDNYIHPTVGYKVADEECDLNYVKEPIEKEILYAMSNSSGFGGHNATLLIKKFED